MQGIQRPGWFQVTLLVLAMLVLGPAPNAVATTPTLCQDVNAALSRITKVLSHCNCPFAGNATHRSGPADLAPVHSMMRAFGCTVPPTRQHETRDTADAIRHPLSGLRATPSIRSTRATTAAQQPAPVLSNITEDHDHRSRPPTLGDGHTAVSHFYGDQEAIQGESGPPHHRVRRVPSDEPGSCALATVIDGTCAGADTDGTLVIEFPEGSSALPRNVSAIHLHPLSAGVTNLTVLGDVHHRPLSWLLRNGNWTAVRVLVFVDLQFRMVDFALFNHLPSISTIGIRNSERITISTQGFARAGQVRVLSLNNNALTHLGDNTFDSFTSLQQLDLGHNHLTRLSNAVFAKTASLTSLNLDGNQLTQISAQLLASVSQLTHLTLSNNRISYIANDAFARLTALTQLLLVHNELHTLAPGTFRGLTLLEDLELSYNPVTALPPTIFSSLYALDRLYLDNMQLTELPDTLLHNLARLRKLSFLINRLTTIRAGLFSNATRLQYLNLSHNRLVNIDETAFRGLTRLEQLFLTTNLLPKVSSTLLKDCRELRIFSVRSNRLRHIPADLFSHTPKLAWLWMGTNQLSSIDTALSHATMLTRLILEDMPLTTLRVALPNLEELYLNGSPISSLPDLTRMPRLQVLRIHDHHITSPDLTPLLHLQWLEKADLTPAPGISPRATVDASALAAWSGNRLRTLRMKNVDASALFAGGHHRVHQQFDVLEMGWPQLSETLLPPEALCSLLVPEARELSISNSGYRHIEICLNVSATNVNLQDNLQLESVRAQNSIAQLNASGCPLLEAIQVPGVEVLDISGTSLRSTPLLCTTLGSRILFARNVAEDLIDTDAWQRCLFQLDLLDLSDNRWLAKPAEANAAVGSVTVLAEGNFLLPARVHIASRRSPPVLQLHRSPLDCTILLESRQLIPLGEEILNEHLVYFFQCSCAQGHSLSSGRCVREQPNIAAIATGSVFGGLTFGLLMMLLYRRYHRLSTSLGEHRQQLLESHEEVIALKKVWEIGFDELYFIKRVAAGAFGVVYKAEWDTLRVAVKVLQQGVMALDETTVAEFEKEVEFLQRTRHPHVVRFFGAGTDPNGSPFLVLEFVALGSLKHLLERRIENVLQKALEERPSTEQDEGSSVTLGDALDDSTLVGTIPGNKTPVHAAKKPESPWDLKVRLLRDVASGMAFIHSLDQVHRDLKSGNVLVSSNLRAKITDFGSIRQCLTRRDTRHAHTTSSGESDPVYSQEAGMATTTNANMTAGVGTPLYMAPEALTGGSYGAQADVFSFGVLMWEVAMERTPDLILQEKGPGFKGPLLSTMDSLLQHGKRLKFEGEADGDVPEWFAAVSRCCMSGDPRSRPTFASLEKTALYCQ